MSPPKLSRDRPIAFLAEPGEILLGVTFGEEFDHAIANHLQRRLRQRGHLHKPLIPQIWLDRRLAPIAVADLGFVRLFLQQQPCAVRSSTTFLGLIAPQAGVRSAVRR